MPIRCPFRQERPRPPLPFALAWREGAVRAVAAYGACYGVVCVPGGREGARACGTIEPGTCTSTSRSAAPQASPCALHLPLRTHKHRPGDFVTRALRSSENAWRAREGRSPFELQSCPATCTPDTQQFLRRGACPPPEKKLPPCSFRARKCAVFQQKLVGVAVAGELAPPPPACQNSF